MRLIKTSNLDDKLTRAGDPTDPLLIRVCELEDSGFKNEKGKKLPLLNWNNIKNSAKNDFSGTKLLLNEIDKFLKNDTDKILNQVELDFKQSLKFKSDKPLQPELSYHERERIEQSIKNLSKWKNLLLGESKEGDFSFRNNGPFAYIVLTSIINNRFAKPIPEALQKLFENISVQNMTPYIEELSKDSKKMDALNNVGINEKDVLGNFNVFIKKMMSVTNSLSNKQKKLSSEIRGSESEIQRIERNQPVNPNRPPVTILTPEETEEKQNEIEDIESIRLPIMKIQMEATNRRDPGGSQTIAQSYVEFQRSYEREEVTGKNITIESLEDGWILIPGGKELDTISYEEDIRNIIPDLSIDSVDERGAIISELCSGTGWCLSHIETATSYISRGNNIFYIENNKPRVCLRYEGKRLIEFTGTANQPINVVPYASKVYELCEKYENIKEDMGGFSSGQSHHSKLSKLKYDEKKVKEFQDKTVEELAELLKQEYDNWGAYYGNEPKPFRYLNESTIAKGSKDPKFFESAKNILLKIPAGEAEYHFGRYAFLKTDRDIVEHSCDLINDELYYIRKHGKDRGMGGVDVSRFNDQLRSIPIKNSRVRENIFETYMELVEKQDKNKETKNTFYKVQSLVSKSGGSHLFKEVATKECIDAITKGNLSKFDNIRVHFNLSDNLDDFKSGEYFELIQRTSADILVNDEANFYSLNDFFEGKLTEEKYFKDIYEQAVVIASDKIINWLSSIKKDVTNISLLINPIKDIVERFPETKSNKDVIDYLVIVGALLITDYPGDFSKLDEIFNKELSEGIHYERIFNESINIAVSNSIVYLKQGKYDEVNQLNDNFKGAILLNDNFIEEGITIAAKYLSELKMDLYKKIMVSFRESLVPELDKIKDIAFENVFSKAKLAFSRGDIPLMKSLNKATRGRLGERVNEVLDASRNMAIDYALSEISWKKIKNDRDLEVESPFIKIKEIDDIYNGALSRNPKILRQSKNILIRAQSLENDEYYKKTVDLIKELYGRDIVSDKDYRVFQEKREKHAIHFALQAIEKNDFKELTNLLFLYKNLKKDRSILFSVLREMSRFSENIKNSEKKLDIFDRLNDLLDGKMISSPKGSLIRKRIINNIQENKRVEELQRRVNPNARLPYQENEGVENEELRNQIYEEDNLNMGNNWYNIFKIT